MPLAAFRRHLAQRSSAQRDRYIAEARGVLARYVNLDHLAQNQGNVVWLRLDACQIHVPELERFREPVLNVQYDDALGRYVAGCH